MLQCFFGFLEYIFSPGEQFCPKIFALALVHKWLFVRRPILLGFGQHSYQLPGLLLFSTGQPPCVGRLIYIRPPVDNIRVRFYSLKTLRGECPKPASRTDADALRAATSTGTRGLIGPACLHRTMARLKRGANLIADEDELIDHATPVTKLLCRRGEIPIVRMVSPHEEDGDCGINFIATPFMQ